MAYSTGARLIETASAAEKISSIGEVFIPSRESHVRPLLKLDSDADRAAAWQHVWSRSGGHRLQQRTSGLLAEDQEQGILAPGRRCVAGVTDVDLSSPTVHRVRV